MSERRLDVVVVEDDPEQRELVVNEIAANGFNVKGCADATALWRHLTVSRCDLIVLDVGLPGEDGLSVAEHLRTASQVGIVMLTGYATSSDQVRGLRHGADAAAAAAAAGLCPTSLPGLWPPVTGARGLLE